MLLYASMTQSQVFDTIKTNTNPMIIKEHTIIIILIISIFILSLILLIVYALTYQIYVFFTINLLSIIFTLIIYIITIKGNSKIKEYINTINENINNLNNKKKIMKDAGLNIDDPSLMNAITDIEKIITILQTNFPSDNAQTIFNLLVSYIHQLQSIDINKIQYILNVLNTLDITNMQNILNQINQYISNGSNINQIKTILSFLQTHNNDLLLIKQILNGKYSRQINLVNRNLSNILTTVSKINVTKDTNGINNLISILNKIDSYALNTIFDTLDGLQKLNNLYNVSENNISTFIGNIINQANIDMDNVAIANDIINLISSTPINAINTIANTDLISNSSELVNILYTYKNIYTLTNTDDNVMMQLFSLPIPSNNDIIDQNNQINTTFNTINMLSNQTDIPLEQLPILIATIPNNIIPNNI